MHFLVESVPIWLLGPVLVVGCAAFAGAGRSFVHRRFPEYSKGTNNALAGSLLMILSGLYGMLAAFTIVNLYADYRDARDVVHQEANNAAEVIRSSEAFDESTREAVLRTIDNYVHNVVEDEWELMTQGKMSDVAWADIDQLYAALQQFEPRTDVELVYYYAATDEAADLLEQRRLRMAHAEETLPTPLFVLIFGGAAMLITFTFFFGSADQIRGQSLMFMFVGAFVGFTLFVIILLDLPFAGQIAIQPDAFREGVLEQFWD